MERMGTMPFGPYYSFRSNGSVTDKVTPDMAHLIHPYWNQFPAVEPGITRLLGVALTFITFFSLFGNGIVIYIFTTTKSLRTPANILIINLAISDFGFMAVNAPMMTLNLYFETWVVGSFCCDLYGMTGSLFGCNSIWSMSVIALDRYEVIVKGINGRPMTTKLAIIKILMIYTMASIWTFAPMMGWSRYVPEGNLTSCGIDYMEQDWNQESYLLAYTVFVWFLPLFTICYAYWFIIATVAAHERAMREQAKKMNVKSLRSSDDVDKCAEAKLAKIALVTISLWFMAWTPYGIINFLGMYRLPGLTPLNTIWGAMFAKASTCYNPIVYATSHPKFRIALKDKCPCLVCGSTEEMKANDNASQATAGEAETKA